MISYFFTISTEISANNSLIEKARSEPCLSSCCFGFTYALPVSFLKIFTPKTITITAPTIPNAIGSTPVTVAVKSLPIVVRPLMTASFTVVAVCSIAYTFPFRLSPFIYIKVALNIKLLSLNQEIYQPRSQPWKL